MIGAGERGGSELGRDATRTAGRRSAGVDGRARARRSDPHSPDAALALALERLREGQAPDVIRALGRGLKPRPGEALRWLASGLFDGEAKEAARTEGLLSLVRLDAQLRGGDRAGAVMSLAALRDAGELAVAGKAWPRALDTLEGWIGVLSADLARLRHHLSTLHRAQDMPRRGAARLAWLAILAGGLGGGERLTLEAFDRRMARGRNALAKRYRYEWTLDDCHTRRYLTQFGFVDRRPDGRAFWRAEARAARLVLSPRAAARVAEWWGAGPKPAAL